MRMRSKPKARTTVTLWLSVVSLALVSLAGLVHYGQVGSTSGSTDKPEDGVTLFVG